MQPDPGYFLPSEICRLVLGFLKEGKYIKSYWIFLNECEHLTEYQSLLKRGQEYPTTLKDVSLPEIINEWHFLKLQQQNCNTAPFARPGHVFAGGLPLVPAKVSGSLHEQLDNALALLSSLRSTAAAPAVPCTTPKSSVSTAGQSARTGIRQAQRNRQLLKIHRGEPSRDNLLNLTPLHPVVRLQNLDRILTSVPCPSVSQTARAGAVSGNHCSTKDVTVSHIVNSDQAYSDQTKHSESDPCCPVTCADVGGTDSSSDSSSDDTDSDGIISVGSPEQPPPDFLQRETCNAPRLPVLLLSVLPEPGSNSLQAGRVGIEHVQAKRGAATASHDLEHGAHASEVNSSSPLRLGAAKRKKPPRRRGDVPGEVGTGNEMQLDKIISNNRFVKTLVDNINKSLYQNPPTQLASHTGDPFGTVAAAAVLPTGSKLRVDGPSDDSCLEDILCRDHRNLPEETVNHIIETTKNDPIFDELFSIFNTDKETYLQREFGRSNTADSQKDPNRDLHTPPADHAADTFNALMSPPTVLAVAAPSACPAGPQIFSSSLTFTTVCIDEPVEEQDAATALPILGRGGTERVGSTEGPAGTVMPSAAASVSPGGGDCDRSEESASVAGLKRPADPSCQSVVLPYVEGRVGGEPEHCTSSPVDSFTEPASAQPEKCRWSMDQDASGCTRAVDAQHRESELVQAKVSEVGMTENEAISSDPHAELLGRTNKQSASCGDKRISRSQTTVSAGQPAWAQNCDRIDRCTDIDTNLDLRTRDESDKSLESSDSSAILNKECTPFLSAQAKIGNCATPGENALKQPDSCSQMSSKVGEVITNLQPGNGIPTLKPSVGRKKSSSSSSKETTLFSDRRLTKGSNPEVCAECTENAEAKNVRRSKTRKQPVETHASSLLTQQIMSHKCAGVSHATVSVLLPDQQLLMPSGLPQTEQQSSQHPHLDPSVVHRVSNSASSMTQCSAHEQVPEELLQVSSMRSPMQARARSPVLEKVELENLSAATSSASRVSSFSSSVATSISKRSVVIKKNRSRFRRTIVKNSVEQVINPDCDNTAERTKSSKLLPNAVSGSTMSPLSNTSSKDCELGHNSSSYRLLTENQPVSESVPTASSTERSCDDDAVAIFLSLRQALLKTHASRRWSGINKQEKKKQESILSKKSAASEACQGEDPGTSRQKMNLCEKVASRKAAPSKAFGSDQPISKKNLPVNPGSSQSSSDHPRNSKDRSVKPGASQSSSVQPRTSKDCSVKPGASQSSSVQPRTSKDCSVKPGASQSSNVQPRTSKDRSVNPGASQSDNLPSPDVTRSKTRTSQPVSDQSSVHASKRIGRKCYQSTPSKSNRDCIAQTLPAGRTPGKNPHKSPYSKAYFDSLYSPRRARLLNEPIPEEVIDEISRHSGSSFTAGATPNSVAALESLQSDLESPFTSPTAMGLFHGGIANGAQTGTPALSSRSLGVAKESDSQHSLYSPRSLHKSPKTRPPVFRRLTEFDSLSANQNPACLTQTPPGGVQQCQDFSAADTYLHTQPLLACMPFVSPHQDLYSISSVVSGPFVFDEMSRHLLTQQPASARSSAGVQPPHDLSHSTSSFNTSSSSGVLNFQVVGSVGSICNQNTAAATMSTQVQTVSRTLVLEKGPVAKDVERSLTEVTTSAAATVSEEHHGSGSSGESAEGPVDVFTKEKARQRVFGEGEGVTSPGDLFISSGAGVGGDETCQQTAISNILPVNVQQFLAHQIETGKLSLLTDLTSDLTFSVSPQKSKSPVISPARPALTKKASQDMSSKTQMKELCVKLVRVSLPPLGEKKLNPKKKNTCVEGGQENHCSPRVLRPRKPQAAGSVLPVATGAMPSSSVSTERRSAAVSSSRKSAQSVRTSRLSDSICVRTASESLNDSDAINICEIELMPSNRPEKRLSGDSKFVRSDNSMNVQLSDQNRGRGQPDAMGLKSRVGQVSASHKTAWNSERYLHVETQQADILALKKDLCQSSGGNSVTAVIESQPSASALSKETDNRIQSLPSSASSSQHLKARKNPSPQKRDSAHSVRLQPIAKKNLLLLAHSATIPPRPVAGRKNIRLSDPRPTHLETSQWDTSDDDSNAVDGSDNSGELGENDTNDEDEGESKRRKCLPPDRKEVLAGRDEEQDSTNRSDLSGKESVAGDKAFSNRGAAAESSTNLADSVHNCEVSDEDNPPRHPRLTQSSRPKASIASAESDRPFNLANAKSGSASSRQPSTGKKKKISTSSSTVQAPQPCQLHFAGNVEAPRIGKTFCLSEEGLEASTSTACAEFLHAAQKGLGDRPVSTFSRSAVQSTAEVQYPLRDSADISSLKITEDLSVMSACGQSSSQSQHSRPGIHMHGPPRRIKPIQISKNVSKNIYEEFVARKEQEQQAHRERLLRSASVTNSSSASSDLLSATSSPDPSQTHLSSTGNLSSSVRTYGARAAAAVLTQTQEVSASPVKHRPDKTPNCFSATASVTSVSATGATLPIAALDTPVSLNMASTVSSWVPNKTVTITESPSTVSAGSGVTLPTVALDTTVSSAVSLNKASTVSFSVSDKTVTTTESPSIVTSGPGVEVSPVVPTPSSMAKFFKSGNRATSTPKPHSQSTKASCLQNTTEFSISIDKGLHSSRGEQPQRVQQPNSSQFLSAVVDEASSDAFTDTRGFNNLFSPPSIKAQNKRGQNVKYKKMLDKKAIRLKANEKQFERIESECGSTVFSDSKRKLDKKMLDISVYDISTEKHQPAAEALRVDSFEASEAVRMPLEQNSLGSQMGQGIVHTDTSAAASPRKHLVSNEKNCINSDKDIDAVIEDRVSEGDQSGLNNEIDHQRRSVLKKGIQAEPAAIAPAGATSFDSGTGCLSVLNSSETDSTLSKTLNKDARSCAKTSQSSCKKDEASTSVMSGAGIGSEDDFEVQTKKSETRLPETRSTKFPKKRTGPVSRKNLFSESPIKGPGPEQLKGRTGITKPSPILGSKSRKNICGPAVPLGSAEQAKHSRKTQSLESVGHLVNTPSQGKKKKKSKAGEEQSKENEASQETARPSDPLLSMPTLGNVLRSPGKLSTAVRTTERSAPVGSATSHRDCQLDAPTLHLSEDGSGACTDGLSTIVISKKRISTLMEQVSSAIEDCHKSGTVAASQDIDQVLCGVKKTNLSFLPQGEAMQSAEPSPVQPRTGMSPAQTLKMPTIPIIMLFNPNASPASGCLLAQSEEKSSLGRAKCQENRKRKKQRRVVSKTFPCDSLYPRLAPKPQQLYIGSVPSCVTGGPVTLVPLIQQTPLTSVNDPSHAPLVPTPFERRSSATRLPASAAPTCLVPVCSSTDRSKPSCKLMKKVADRHLGKLCERQSWNERTLKRKRAASGGGGRSEGQKHAVKKRKKCEKGFLLPDLSSPVPLVIDSGAETPPSTAAWDPAHRQEERMSQPKEKKKKKSRHKSLENVINRKVRKAGKNSPHLSSQNVITVQAEIHSQQPLHAVKKRKKCEKGLLLPNLSSPVPLVIDCGVETPPSTAAWNPACRQEERISQPKKKKKNSRLLGIDSGAETLPSTAAWDPASRQKERMSQPKKKKNSRLLGIDCGAETLPSTAAWDPASRQEERMPQPKKKKKKSRHKSLENVINRKVRKAGKNSPLLSSQNVITVQAEIHSQQPLNAIVSNPVTFRRVLPVASVNLKSSSVVFHRNTSGSDFYTPPTGSRSVYYTPDSDIAVMPCSLANHDLQNQAGSVFQGGTENALPFSPLSYPDKTGDAAIVTGYLQTPEPSLSLQWQQPQSFLVPNQDATTMSNATVTPGTGSFLHQQLALPSDTTTRQTNLLAGGTSAAVSVLANASTFTPLASFNPVAAPSQTQAALFQQCPQLVSDSPRTDAAVTLASLAIHDGARRFPTPLPFTSAAAAREENALEAGCVSEIKRFEDAALTRDKKKKKKKKRKKKSASDNVICVIPPPSPPPKQKQNKNKNKK